MNRVAAKAGLASGYELVLLNLLDADSATSTGGVHSIAGMFLTGQVKWPCAIEFSF
jgi:hypothetical protein